MRSGIVGTWVLEDVCKALEMGYGLVDVYEFWECSVTRSDKGKNSGVLFAEHFNMFLELNKKLSGYPYWFHR
jgi:hypothetical protein